MNHGEYRLKLASSQLRGGKDSLTWRKPRCSLVSWIRKSGKERKTAANHMFYILQL